MGDTDKDIDLPRPGLEEEPEGEAGGEVADPTLGPGNVSVDEPTAPALSESDDSWEDGPAGEEDDS